jgi:plasmid maintenance system killer protein
MTTEIDWTYLTVEMSLLAMIIFGAVYADRWHYHRVQQKEDRQTHDRIKILITRDLERKLEIIRQTRDQKRIRPMFTSIWDSVLFTGKQRLLQFELFDRLHLTYSLMHYYNSEIQKSGTGKLEGHAETILSDIQQRVQESLAMLKASQDKDAQ